MIIKISKILKISIGIILYKNTKYLEKCISSLLNQSYTNFELLLRDQDENNFEAIQYLKEKFPEFLQDSRVKVFKGKNLWHSGGHNFLISEMSEDSQAYVCASNDMLYEKDCIKKLVENLNKNQEYSISVPKLKRWDFENMSKDNNFGKTNFIDSCGIGLHANHAFFDIGQAELDEGQYDAMKEIFGASGALFLAKKEALQMVKGFDELIHYKNDIDLSYRFLWAGYKTIFVSDSISYHDRQVSNDKQGGSSGNMGLIQKIIKNNKNKPLWVKESSFFGHLVFLYKNVCCMNFPISTRIKILWYMLRATGFLLLTEPKVLLQYKKFFSVFSGLQQKKEKIIKNSKEKKISVLQITKFFK